MTTALGIIGQTFDHAADGSPTQQGWDELTRALSMYSDKRYETARYLFVKDGKIARHIAVSSKQPSETIARPDDNFLYSIRDYAEDTDSSVVFVHNHPSGHIIPSEADIKLTNMLENVFTDQKGKKRLLGHAILDHGNFGLYTPSRGWNALVDGNIVDINDAETTHDDTTRPHIYTDADLVNIATIVQKLDAGNSWDKTRWVHSVFVDVRGTITTHELIGLDEFESPDRLIRKLKDIGRTYGSPSIYMFPSDNTQHLICERFAIDTGVIRDVCYKNEQGKFELSQSSGGSLFSRIMEEDVIVEDTDTFDPNIVKEKMERNGADTAKTITTRHADVSSATKESISKMPVVTDAEFSLFIDNLFDKKYTAIPQAIRLPNFDDTLSALLNIKTLSLYSKTMLSMLDQTEKADIIKLLHERSIRKYHL